MVVSGQPIPGVIWHDLECGAYTADLPLWRELAAAGAGHRGAANVLDIGAGTGRVALDLARAGHRVTALDSDQALLSALTERAGGLPVEAVHADGRQFSLERRDFDLCLVPMQTLQLLRGAAERGALFEHARDHLRPGALLACALVTEVDCFDSRSGRLGPSPERVKIGSTLYLSRAVRVQRDDSFVRIERDRLVLPAGEEQPEPAAQDVVELEIVAEQQLWDELRAAGLVPEPTRRIAETEEHSGSDVVIAHA
jgi:SAM-dependent methyltransferase